MSRHSRFGGENEFIRDSLTQQEDFPSTEKMPLQEEHDDFANPDFADSVVSEDMDYETVPMDLMSELEYSATQHTKPDEIKPLMDEKFFKFDVQSSRPDDYQDSIIVEEDVTMSAALYNYFFKK